MILSSAKGRSGPVAHWLNKKGWKTTHGKHFSSATLACKGGIFRNRALVGETTIQFEKKTVVIHHEAILDKAKFEAINAVLDGRKLREPRSPVLYALGGLGICGCGAKFESHKAGNHRYYVCRKRCGEKVWRKDTLERAVWNRLGAYLRERQARSDYLELALQSETKIKDELVRITQELAKNSLEWRSLLDKDLAGYPAEIVNGKKAELNAARESLEWRKAEIEAQLLLLPKVNPEEVERELATLSGPWLMFDWSTQADGDCHSALLPEQAESLRETLLRLGARYTVKNGEVRILGRLPVGSESQVCAKVGASESLYALW